MSKNMEHLSHEEDFRPSFEPQDHKEVQTRSEHKPVGNERNEAAIARSEAMDEALGKEDYKPREQTHVEQEKSANTPRGSAKQSFNKTMARTRNNMTAAQRGFSRFIHIPAVEKVSESLSTTVARPNAILSGSVFALIITGSLYLVAKYYGFSLSGSETMLAFAMGWLIGIIFDSLRLALKRRS